MLGYEECKEIAQRRADEHKISIDKAYDIGNDYVFDNSADEAIGILPMVVNADNGEIKGLWLYLNDNDMTMDDMIEREF